MEIKMNAFIGKLSAAIVTAGLGIALLTASSNIGHAGPAGALIDGLSTTPESGSGIFLVADREACEGGTADEAG